MLLLYSKSGDLAAAWRRMLLDGFPVQMYVDKAFHRKKRLYRGIVPQLDAWSDAAAQKADAVVFDMVGFGERADALRKFMPVWGGGCAQDMLELNRGYGFEVMARSGIRIPHTVIVNPERGLPAKNISLAGLGRLHYMKGHIPETRRFVLDSGIRWVLKPYGHGVTSLTYVSTSAEDMDRRLAEAQEKTEIKPEHPFILQQFVAGTEVSTEIWVQHGTPIHDLTNATLETKRFMNGDLGPNTGCYSEDTEILTAGGWKRYTDLRVGEAVLSYNMATGICEYQPIERIWTYAWSRPMCHFQLKTVDLLVTPDHHMLVQSRSPKHTKRTFREAHALMSFMGSNLSFVRKSDWVGEEPRQYCVPAHTSVWRPHAKLDDRDLAAIHALRAGGATYQQIADQLHVTDSAVGYSVLGKRTSTAFQSREIPAVNVRMEDWLAFLGLYLAEGHVAQPGNQVAINQAWHDPQIEAILDALPWKFYRTRHGWKTSSAQLFAALVPLGHAYEKFVPREFLQLSARLLSILLEYLMLGDGSVQRSGQRTYYTSSRQLADDVQEIFQKIGSEAIVRVRDRRGTIMKTKSPGVIRHLSYEVIERRKRTTMVKNTSRSYVPYDGTVWCVTVPNHTVYVRRNGNAIWCGNCQTSAVWFYVNPQTPIYAKTLGLPGFQRWLRQPIGPSGETFTSYHGPLDLNTIVADRDGEPYGLEWTPRHGYSAIYALLDLINETFYDLWLRAAQGRLDRVRTRPGVGFAVRVSVPPYPGAEEFDEKKFPESFAALMELATDEAILGPVDDPRVWLLDAKLERGRLMTAGADGVVLEVTGRGPTVAAAAAPTYALVKKIQVGDAQYRTDGAQNADERLRKLLARGYDGFQRAVRSAVTA